LAGREAPRRSPVAPLTVIDPDKTGGFSFRNQTVWLFLF
jgi:hypothetical protein